MYWILCRYGYCIFRQKPLCLINHNYSVVLLFADNVVSSPDWSIIIDNASTEWNTLHLNIRFQYNRFLFSNIHAQWTFVVVSMVSRSRSWFLRSQTMNSTWLRGERSPPQHQVEETSQSSTSPLYELKLLRITDLLRDLLVVVVQCLPVNHQQQHQLLLCSIRFQGTISKN